VTVSDGERWLRRVYRAVLAVAGVYYYISLPVVLVLVVGVCVVSGYIFLQMGKVPIYFAFMLVIGAIATIAALIKSLTLRMTASAPGRLLERTEAGALWQLTEEVGRTMKTRPIDEIRITDGTDLAVYERGTWRERMENRAQRILVLGTGLLEGFKQDDFRSVLAHEYGHFAHRDTAGGDIALRVCHDMRMFHYAMVVAEQDNGINIGFHFLRLYSFIYQRISRGATRLQEILADRVAAQTYGASAFEGGLRHVIRQSIAFDHWSEQEIKNAIKSGWPVRNRYGSDAPHDPRSDTDYIKAIEEPTTEDDTHPSPIDRFRMIAGSSAPSRASSSHFVWELFSDRDAVAREMMAKIEQRIAKHRD
jgi:Zn-dependent protease with chaperone function